MLGLGKSVAAAKGSIVSRREFLRRVVLFGTGGALHWLVGCNPSPSETPSPTASPIGTEAPVPTPTPQPTSTLRPEPALTPTVIADAPLFDEATLTPVFVAHDPGLQGYPSMPPFGADQHYPECPYRPDDLTLDNGAYRLVRQSLRLMNPEDYGATSWNPLGSVIRPGDCVLIKPNLVDDSEWANGQTTHPAILRPIIDYAYKACGPTGRILLAEGPWAAGVFDRLVANMGIQDMVTHLVASYGVPLKLLDLNKASRETAPLVDLGAVSELRAVDRVWYDAHGMVMHEVEDPGVGRYRIAPAVLEADVIISVPKVKVHCSGGVTLAMKNMLGIIPAWDGPHEQAQLKDCAHTSDVDRAAGARGMYLDNDTIWRSMADLNRILLYADVRGILHQERQRRYLAIVDGIVAAEESQYHPHPYPLHTVVVGTDPVTVDAITARCMGFDPRLLKSVTSAAARTSFPLGPAHPAQISVVVSGEERVHTLYQRALTPELHVFPWQGYVEASDFEPPKVLDWAWDVESKELRVTLGDPAGVTWARVSYTHQGETRVKALKLMDGTAEEGQWRVPFPLGETVGRAELASGDWLFNETRQEITW
ncbi:MAG: DUF362 domain-containing protein [Anaerolineae bacterium]